MKFDELINFPNYNFGSLSIISHLNPFVDSYISSIGKNPHPSYNS